MFLKRTIAAVAIVLGTTAAANAADPVMTVPTMPPPVVTAPAFDWSGPYVGAYTGWSNLVGWHLGAQAGYNFDLGGFVVGIEGRVGAAPLIPIFIGSVSGRVGVALGAEDRLLLYGATGVGYGGGFLFYSFGGGAEYAIGESLSIFGEARGVGVFGLGCCGYTVQAGLNWHL